jgi:hypothetical protein
MILFSEMRIPESNNEPLSMRFQMIGDVESVSLRKNLFSSFQKISKKLPIQKAFSIKKRNIFHDMSKSIIMSMFDSEMAKKILIFQHQKNTS